MKVVVVKFALSTVFASFLLVNCFAQNKIISVAHSYKEGAFPLAQNGNTATIYYDRNDATVVKIAANMFKQDLIAVTGLVARVDSSFTTNKQSVLVGTLGKCKLIDELLQRSKLNQAAIAGKWETFSMSVVDDPFGKGGQALVIAGSDPRGTAFGILELSKMMGVAPFTWWADIVPDHHQQIFITKGVAVVGPPSVKYRGIFINDEDWGLQPWAAKTFEPETGDIGRKTYAEVFELLLRLKANVIWPAMHPSTKAFYHYPGNKQVAADYAIVVGSSHAEPMLRNNVSEWNAKTMGAFNYITNKASVYKYWEERVKESAANDAMYTLGMRGVHDSGIEGVKSAKEAVPLIERIIEDQRAMLGKYVNKNVTAIPQVFTAYKEVLEIYDSNLRLPADVTVVWPDDNYGYIQRLNSEAERNRAGGSGVYYHASYWGRPHDYLWLSSTHPALIREEMMKAYDLKADKLWVLNVGDIKPLEYNIEIFMDMAFNVNPFKDAGYPKKHLYKWAAKAFGGNKATAIQDILWQYYQLAFERRPEFMGWSQTEPTTKTNYTEYNHFYYGDEAQKRIDKYNDLTRRVQHLRTQMAAKDADAFYQLVYYPVVGASLMNKKFLYRDKSYLYARQNRLSAYDYESLSRQAYDSIEEETRYYNNKLSGGKWNNIMSMKPRDLPVYQQPVMASLKIDSSVKWSVAPEGFIKPDSVAGEGNTLHLPSFNEGTNLTYFIDVFLSDNKAIQWSATPSSKWVVLSAQSGNLSPAAGKKEQRIWVSVNWSKMPATTSAQSIIIFSAGDKQVKVAINAVRSAPLKATTANYFVERNGYISMFASSYSNLKNKGNTIWKVVEDLGHTGKSLEAVPLKFSDDNISSASNLQQHASFAAYNFHTTTSSAATAIVYTLPTLPINKNFSMRYGVAVDDAPVEVVDFKTIGRTEEWKQNVLRNNAIKTIKLPYLQPGEHTLRVYTIDPGVILDRMVINLGGLKKGYGVVPETRYINQRSK